ncbi:hypothetical protein CLV92_10619 [Kineococcus xinjiangensis]|uniref:DUF1844 domain-containing protein n=1 Tax=Kineococcus xinjiangensis TaxID=512762 RepID=A0A2S6ILY5_9ACTN|nr:DUF1844 domain-containing protein [Kineococcus xinjiangensis]PPK95198.1 hypothetical protein CLV92_10619 [Kineococcus xinjiangensis]
MQSDSFPDGPPGDLPGEGGDPADTAVRDIADVPSAQIITTAAVHLMSAAAVKCGLAEDADTEAHLDLAEARILINALAGLVTAAAPDVGGTHARALRDGLRTLQLAFREASTHPDPPGKGPGERLTGSVV